MKSLALPRRTAPGLTVPNATTP